MGRGDERADERRVALKTDFPGREARLRPLFAHLDPALELRGRRVGPDGGLAAPSSQGGASPPTAFFHPNTLTFAETLPARPHCPKGRRAAVISTSENTGERRPPGGPRYAGPTRTCLRLRSPATTPTSPRKTSGGRRPGWEELAPPAMRHLLDAESVDGDEPPPSAKILATQRVIRF